MDLLGNVPERREVAFRVFVATRIARPRVQPFMAEITGK